jgi:hypothetical protein
MITPSKLMERIREIPHDEWGPGVRASAAAEKRKTGWNTSAFWLEPRLGNGPIVIVHHKAPQASYTRVFEAFWEYLSDKERARKARKAA